MTVVIENLLPFRFSLEPGTPSSTVEMSPPPTPEKKPVDKKQKAAKPAKVKPPGRVKGPLDLDKQCGVVMVVGGPACARSLTCKSHSMSAKRGVEGRSRPYDVLLGLYQKKPMPGKISLHVSTVPLTLTLTHTLSLLTVESHSISSQLVL